MKMTQTRAFKAATLLACGLPDMPTFLSVVKALVGSAHLSEAEVRVLNDVGVSLDFEALDSIRAEVLAGNDPLGSSYCLLVSPEARRISGQTFTPGHVVEGMLAWAKRQGKAVKRLVDPGAGSGRYTLAALRAFPEATAVAVEMDPVVALILRANLAVAGFSERVEVVVNDFRAVKVPRINGTTLWLGNPPYVRHHDIPPEWKTWYSETLSRFSHTGSKLAGLHLHFFLKTLEQAAEGDIGCYVTAAEWLDVKYGQALRQQLTNGLGGIDVFVVNPTVQVFGDAMVSAAITCFSPGSKRTELKFAKIETIEQLRNLTSGASVQVATAKAEPKWTFLVKGGRVERPAGYIELGELFQVSRGQVTGLNEAWVKNTSTPELPSRFLVPTITESADITKASGHVIADADTLRCMVCLPKDLSTLDKREYLAVTRFLEWAKKLGAHETYIATHRNPWWSVTTREAAPIVMTYMGRRPPVFALNKAGAQLINVAHGLYPREAKTEAQMLQVVSWLNTNVSKADGRVYAGGLTKFEPSEAMKILIPEALMD